MSTSWEDLKRAGQSVYLSAGNGFQDRNGFGQAYRQFLLTGQLDSRRIAHRDVHHQIAEEPYQPTKADWQEYAHHRDAWEKENPDSRLTGPDPDAPELG